MIYTFICLYILYNMQIWSTIFICIFNSYIFYLYFIAAIKLLVVIGVDVA